MQILIDVPSGLQSGLRLSDFQAKVCQNLLARQYKKKNSPGSRSQKWSRELREKLALVVIFWCYGSATFRLPKSGWIKYVVCIVRNPENFAYCHRRGIRFSL